MVVERATLHAQKLDLQDLATHSADASKQASGNAWVHQPGATNALRRSSFRLSFKLAMKHCAAQHRSLWGTMSLAHSNL
jgi:hypothetical protein